MGRLTPPIFLWVAVAVFAAACGRDLQVVERVVEVPVVEERIVVVEVEKLVEIETERIVEVEVEVVEEAEIENGHLGKFPPSLTVASIEERILLSDVVVRANLVSAANDVLIFDAVEYLRGTGPQQFTVSAKTAGRNTQWDSHEAILFLSDPASDQARTANATFEFPTLQIGHGTLITALLTMRAS